VLRNKEDAEDAVQDALCKAYARLHSFEGWSSFSSWVTRIVINSSLMILRSRRTRLEASLDEILESQPEWLPQEAYDGQPDPETICSATELNAHFEKRVRQLRPTLRAAFRLGVTDGLSALEASRALGISVKAFKSRFFWARRKVVWVMQRRFGLARG
jgi:RNA polymerase sigma-70 factor (ECF subfamily)